MRKIFLISTLALAVLLVTSCDEDCENFNHPSCTEVAPTDEPCLAYFERWFYDEATQGCTEIAYSGCSSKGFTTQAECEDCDCVEE